MTLGNSVAGLLLLLTLTCKAWAGPIFTITDIGVVTTPTNEMTFDGGVSGLPYVEDGIMLESVGGGVSSSLPFYYAFNDGWATLSLQSGALITALDFIFGDGFTDVSGNYFDPARTVGEGDGILLWQTFRDGVTTGFGGGTPAIGKVLGWTDPEGFTSIRVAAVEPSLVISSAYWFGELQGIAIDNVRVGTPVIVSNEGPDPEEDPTSNAVPTPGTLALMGFGIVALARARRV